MIIYINKIYIFLTFQSLLFPGDNQLRVKLGGVPQVINVIDKNHFIICDRDILNIFEHPIDNKLFPVEIGYFFSQLSNREVLINLRSSYIFFNLKLLI